MQLELWLEITNQNNTSEEIIFNSVRFYLDENILQEIHQAKAKKNNIKLTSSYREELRTFAIVEQAGLTFYSYYQEKAILKSIIFPDGKIIYQICKNCLENPELTQKIITAHHWLIDQLLANVTLEKNKIMLSWLTWVLSLLLIIVIGLLNFDKLIPITPVKIITSLGMIFLFYWGIKMLLQKIPIYWKRRLFLGIFSPNTKLRKIAWYILENIKI